MTRITALSQLSGPSSFTRLLRSEIQRLEKVELHLHLGGSWPLEFLRSQSDPQTFLELSHFIEALSRGMDYHQAFGIFPLIHKIVNTPQKVEEGVIALCHELSKDHGGSAEFRTGLRDFGNGLEEHLLAVLRGIER